MINDDSQLLKLKHLGWSDERIAAKLGWDVELVRTRYQAFIALAIASESSGHIALVNHFNLLCSQYQLMGESLKILGMALSANVSSADLQAWVVDDPDTAGIEILKRYIVLPRFVTQDPQASLDAAIKQN